MKISATAKFLVRNIVMGKVTYLEVVNARPDLKDEVDAYIKQEGIVVDKTV